MASIPGYTIVSRNTFQTYQAKANINYLTYLVTNLQWKFVSLINMHKSELWPTSLLAAVNFVIEHMQKQVKLY